MNLTRALALPCCAVVALGVAACFSAPPRPQNPSPPPAPIETPPPQSVPDAVPRFERRARNGNPPFYDVLGKRYFVLSSSVGYVERGVASWYGPGFHKVRTSIGEPYDMYGMTAAHKTLPLPAYVRVTNLQNGRSVVVRVNDRGPFVGNRIIDLSYTAASKLDMLRNGTAMVEVRSLDAPPAANTAALETAPPAVPVPAPPAPGNWLWWSAVPALSVPGMAQPGRDGTGTTRPWLYIGHVPVAYLDYLDVTAGRTLYAWPGNWYSMTPVNSRAGLTVPPPDHCWLTAANQWAPRVMLLRPPARQVPPPPRVLALDALYHPAGALGAARVRNMNLQACHAARPSRPQPQGSPQDARVPPPPGPPSQAALDLAGARAANADLQARMAQGRQASGR